MPISLRPRLIGCILGVHAAACGPSVVTYSGKLAESPRAQGEAGAGAIQVEPSIATMPPALNSADECAAGAALIGFRTARSAEEKAVGAGYMFTRSSTCLEQGCWTIGDDASLLGPLAGAGGPPGEGYKSITGAPAVATAASDGVGGSPPIRRFLYAVEVRGPQPATSGTIAVFMTDDCFKSWRAVAIKHPAPPAGQPSGGAPVRPALLVHKEDARKVELVYSTAPDGALFIASSEDGGASFKDARQIEIKDPPWPEDRKAMTNQFPKLAQTGDGRLALAWANVNDIEGDFDDVTWSVSIRGADGAWGSRSPIASGFVYAKMDGSSNFGFGVGSNDHLLAALSFVEQKPLTFDSGLDAGTRMRVRVIESADGSLWNGTLATQETGHQFFPTLVRSLTPNDPTVILAWMHYAPDTSRDRAMIRGRISRADAQSRTFGELYRFNGGTGGIHFSPGATGTSFAGAPLDGSRYLFVWPQIADGQFTLHSTIVRPGGR